MKFTQAIKRSLAALLAMTLLLAYGLSARAASAQIPYNPNGTPTTKTPVFNQFTGVPNGVGNEADFVRVKTQAGGNADYVNSLNSACNTGDAFTVRTYVHNGADPAFNTAGGATAIAHNTVVKMTAPLNTSKSSFEFKSTISASNAATVTDNGFLNCNGKTVRIALIPGSVKTYSQPLGFHTVSDSAVNGSLRIGSRVQGSGDVLACWEDRVTVTFEVKVVPVPPQPQPSLGECKLLTVKAVGGRRIDYSIEGATTNATITSYRITFGDGNSSTAKSGSHTYSKDGTFDIVAFVTVKFANNSSEEKTSASCKASVTFTPEQPPKVTPPPEQPQELPVTGPAGVGAMAGLVSGLSSVGYYLFNRRRG